MDEKHKRLLHERRERRQERKATVQSAPKHTIPHKGIYHDHYKALLIFTFSVLFLSLAVIGYTYVTTGDIFYKGVSLSGGVTITVPTGASPVDIAATEQALIASFPENDLIIREIAELGTQQGITIEATTPDGQGLEALSARIIAALPVDTSEASVEITGPALGASFFQQTFKALLIAFVSMGFVVFLYFGQTPWQKIGVAILSVIEATLLWYANGTIMYLLALLVAIALVTMYLRYSIPSTAVILAAFSTLAFTIAVLDLMQYRISTAGIAALLMLLGYSVDTDILLSTRVLKSNAGTVYERIVSTVKTGLTMTGTTFTAACVALIFTQSDVIREIMTIVVIGIFADIFYTWIQNSGILRWYLEKHGRGSDDA
jgi:preprotein translocase subunit SecF